MLLLGKIALYAGSTLAVAGAVVFHEGVIRVDVVEQRQGGQHVHLWVPATVVPVGLHLAPKKEIERAAAETRQYLPLIRAVSHELQRYPNATFVEVQDAEQHVRISTQNGKIHIDVDSPDEVVHVAVPLETLLDVSDTLEANAPSI